MTNPLHDWLRALQQSDYTFAKTLHFIAEHYLYQPQAFQNGPLQNAAGDNEGSCKIFGVALLEQLTREQALLAFGEHYQHVLANPTGTDHANIRQLLHGGLDSVSFATLPVQRKASVFPDA